MALQRIKQVIQVFSPYFLFTLVGMGLMAYIVEFYFTKSSWDALRSFFYVIEAVIKLY